MRRPSLSPRLFFAALAVVPFLLMAVSPPTEPVSTAPCALAEAVAPAQSLDAASGPATDLEALEVALFEPQIVEAASCCPPNAQSACEAACAPDPGFAACGGHTCFCVCISIN